MKITTYIYDTTWNNSFDPQLNLPNTLIIVFGSIGKNLINKPITELVNCFTNATIIGASTAGEILEDKLLSSSLVVSVINFETTTIKYVAKSLSNAKDSFDCAKDISTELLDDNLKAIFVLSDGLNVNGSQLTQGFNASLPNDVIVTGGLAGDDDRFLDTWIIVNNKLQNKYVSAIGLYGDNINVSYGSKGGWDTLGVQRLVTKSQDNILYELDSKPALELYKTYLGKQADDLPASGLLFPLELKYEKNSKHSKVRTILAVNEDHQSITFAGDIPTGSYVKLMRANYDRLIDGAEDAAKSIVLSNYKDENILSIAISCVGRKLVLKQRTEEEIEAVLDELPINTKQIGFYAYGEISPLDNGVCDLHNQTMTLTLLWENDA
jgi:hypothetical protein